MTESFLGRFLLPLLLVTASLLNWSFVSLVDLIAFLVLQLNASRSDFRLQTRLLLLWSVSIFSLLAACLQVLCLILWVINGGGGSTSEDWWLMFIGFRRFHVGGSLTAVYFSILHLLIGVVSLADMYQTELGLFPWRGTCWRKIVSAVDQLGYYVKVASCFLLPAIQLFVGISHPSWASLPFFICSCIGLVDWSLTSNYSGLFRWWRSVQLFAGINIALLYVYQLPVEFPSTAETVANFIGLYKISAESDWLEISSGLSLIFFYFMLSSIKSDLEEMELFMSGTESDLTEHLLPSRHTFYIHESRSGVRHTNVLVRGTVFRIFTINFFTYGFLVSLFALCFWSFHFASICAFGLLAYVGYTVYAFPTLFRLHQLNGLLLVFILLWAISTYIFNVAFAYVNLDLGKDMEIWELAGLWRYPVPGYFLLAQYGLGVLVALGNLVNNSVFTYVSNENETVPNGENTMEVKEETKVLIVATIAWGLRKCSRPIMSALIFFIAMRPGYIHAVYIVFFLIYILSYNISRKTRQALILLCEAHFALLYVLQINWISKHLNDESSVWKNFFSELGLLDSDGSWEFLEIAILICICAFQNHGFDLLFSFSAIVFHTPCRPVGFSVLKAGLNKSVLLSVYAASSNAQHIPDGSSYERKVALFLSAIGEKFLSVYRSWGTYIAFVTILLTVYTVQPNYISFGYVFLLLFWIIGRQLVEKTRRRLWFPLKAYAIAVFIFIYSLSIFRRFTLWFAEIIDLYPNLGFKLENSLMDNVWESLAILIVMQLYSYERRKSKNQYPGCPNLMQPGLLGFIKRLLVWHGHKVLFIAIFYASISPISAFGFLYLLGLILCSILPKMSRVPSKSFLVYTGFLVTIEYLFQMWGQIAGMFPGQRHYIISRFLGLQVFKLGFWGIESCLRGKVLVIAACTLQYNIFHWLDMTSQIPTTNGKWEEPCPLFVSAENGMRPSNFDEENGSPSCSDILFSEQKKVGRDALPSFPDNDSHRLHSGVHVASSSSIQKYSFGYFWGSTKESQKWNKRRILAFRNERFDMQKTTLKVYLKFWMENMFYLFGLEINMIALLLLSFVLLNVISLLYIALLAAFVLLHRRIISKLWPILVCLFAGVLTLEYLAIWNSVMHVNDYVPAESTVKCHDCWRSSSIYSQFCEKCWLGIIIDDSRMILSYFLVFMLACFKLRAHRIPSLSGSATYHEMMSHRKYVFVWKDLSFETKSMWTIFDYLRLYCYCHLLDLVLALILITGTLEYDILHLGYLGCALVFFRRRIEILRKRNKIFKFLRIYNFVIIVLSLAYQSPYFGDFNEGKCGTIDYIYEIVGFYKYDYGFRITSRSALVEIIIFMLVSLQSYMFSSPEFEHVSRYLEAEQIGAIVREQEKRAARKTAQLLQIRESEEEKRHRNLQVEKMKSEMLDLQIQLHSSNTLDCGYVSPSSAGLRRRRTTSVNLEKNLKDQKITGELMSPLEFPESPVTEKSYSPSTAGSMKQGHMEFPFCEITEYEEDIVDDQPMVDVRQQQERGARNQLKGKEHPLKSAVQLIGDSVFQVQTLGNQAVNNIASFLNISQDDLELDDHHPFVKDKVEDAVNLPNTKQMHFDCSSSLNSDRTTPESASLQLGRIFGHIWSQMQSNNDIVCYCCFVLVFLWNFSLFSMVYLGALFLYALCVNTGPSYTFWIVVLIYTEVYILLQYLYQIIIQHCGLSVVSELLNELGFPDHKINSSFVVSSLPLFLVYLFTLLQSSITAPDGEWNSLKEVNMFGKKGFGEADGQMNYSWNNKVKKLFRPIINMANLISRSLLRYWKSLTRGAESPPYFVQLSMDVGTWPEDGIQPEKVESAINQLLKTVHSEYCENDSNSCPYASRVNIQSIERSNESLNVAIAVFEAVYASPSTKCKHSRWYESLTPAADVAKEILLAKHSGFVQGIRFPYHILSVIGGGRREVDLYAYIFGADLSVFFLVAMFYQSIIKNKSEFLEVYQLEDQFPKEFVSILMIIFFLIVLDRIIYLCSFASWKVLFYLFNLVLFTYSVTQYAWHMKPSQQYAGILALRAIYLMKAVSLALQAVQIRYGVPHKSTLYRQFLTSEVSRINYLGYRLYRALPFLYELRCVLDWSCTTTSLTMYDWLKLEDINASLYLVKCDTVLNRAGHKQGEKQSKMTKFCNGLCLFFILICVIWAPMLMYSSGNPTNIANPIRDASAHVDLKTRGGRLTLYQTTLCEKLRWDEVERGSIPDPHSFLRTYERDDIQVICCQADASMLWLIPEVVQMRYVDSLDAGMAMTFTWVLTRDRPKGKEVVRFERLVEKPDLPDLDDVMAVLNGTANSFRVYDIYPRYFRVTGSGDVRPFEPEVNPVAADLVINNQSSKWWSLYDITSPRIKRCEGLLGPMAVVVSEETPQGIIGDTLSKFSIWGLYITFVLAVGRFIRLQCSDLRMRIPYENLPSTDRLIAICEDIYAARAEGELGVEEVLYWTLVKIYRSPHMLLEYTKPD